ncbi:MAG: hypothetical protein M3Y91_08750 [Actinomycetota bacterium]|nr:hypothetical protein [Actinomycetota bacterium]
MSWRVLTDRAWNDLEAFEDEERAALTSDLLEWIDAGPPRINRRSLAGVELYDDRLPSGFQVVYLVDQSVPFAALLRVRRAR